MLLNIRGKNHTVQNKVYTTKIIDEVLRLFRTWYDEMTSESGGDVTECLYEIRFGTHLYSGLNESEFRDEISTHGSADYIRILLRKEPSARAEDNADSKVNNVQIELVLNKAGDSYFRVGGDSARWVDSVSNQFLECNDRAPTRNRVMNSRWMEMAVQVSVAILLTITSIFAAHWAETIIDYPYSAIYVFVVTFIFLSNVWTFILQALKDLRSRLYPVVDIRSEPRPRYSAGLVGALFLIFLGWAIENVLDLLLVNGV